MRFNINNYVSVKLTDRGRDIHTNYWRGILPRREPVPAVVEVDGWSRWQMWELMHIFGSHCFNGCDPPFETEIEIEEKALA